MTPILITSTLTAVLIIVWIVWTRKAKRRKKHKEQFARLFERIVKENQL